MNEEQIEELETLVNSFEADDNAQNYKKLSEFLDKCVPNFREVYHLVNSAAYAEWSAAE